MINLPVDCDLAALGLEAAQITAATLISRRHNAAGRTALASPPGLPEFLRREADILDPGIIL